MSDTQSSPAGSASTNGWGWLKQYADEIVLATLLVLSFIGIGVTDFSTSSGAWYWLVMVPVFGLTCLITQWSHARAFGVTPLSLIGTQVLHWGALLVAIEVLYRLVAARGMDSANIGLVIVVMLALTTFLAGVYTGWRFCLVGIFLAIAALIATYIEAYLWVVLLVGTLVAVAAVAWTHYSARRANNTT